MIALIRKNLRLWGYGKSLALFAGCILFSISGRLNGGIAYEWHILSAVSDHYYLTYFVLPIVLLSCFSFIDDDGEPVILRFQSYHSYFLKKWIGVGLIAVILTAVQTGAILLSGIGLPLGNEWNLAAGTTEAELFSALEQLFVSPLQAFVCFTLFQLIGIWLIFGICMWIGHFTERKWTIRIVIVLYVLSAVWIKLPAIQNIPLTSFNHLLILHHNFGEPARPWITGFTLLLFMLTIMFSVRFAWRGHLPQLRLKCHGSGTIDGIEWELKDGVLTIRGEGALRETPWSENVDRIQKVIIAAVGDSNSLFTRYHKLPGILCFVTSVCRRPRSRHSITWSATLMSCCVLQFLM